MKWLYRILFYVLGLFLIATGVTVSINSNLGSSPINSFPFAISRVSGVNLGTCVTIVFCCYILIQIIMLRRDFKPKNLLQILFSTLFGYFVNLTKLIFGWLIIPTYAGQLAMMLISIAFIGLGLVFYITVDIVPLPTEGLALAATQKIPKLPFHRAKTILDSTSVVLAITISLIGTGNINGIREGTIISALLIGKVMSIFAKPLRPIVQRICFGAPKAAEEALAEATTEASPAVVSAK